MSRVERTETPNERQRSDEWREAQRARRETSPAGTTPGKAEGEERDVEQALENQQE